MRVNSGRYRFRALASPKGEEVRPTAGIIKQSVFNMLREEMAGAHFLDLFAGTGQMGIEALSAGAAFAVFADNGKESQKALAENLSFLPKESYRLLRLDYRTALQALKGNTFQFIFADPPYHAGYYDGIFAGVQSAGLLAPEGLIVLEHDSALDIVPLSGYNKQKTKAYGRRAVSLFTKSE